MEIVRRLHDNKAEMSEIFEIKSFLSDLDNKLKHVAVLSADMALTMVPQKLSGKFTNINDLNSHI